jgi:hypothetical protein
MTDAFWYNTLGAYNEALESLKQWLATTQEGQLFADTQILWKPAFDPARRRAVPKDNEVSGSSRPAHPFKTDAVNFFSELKPRDVLMHSKPGPLPTKRSQNENTYAYLRLHRRNPGCCDSVCRRSHRGKQSSWA